MRECGDSPHCVNFSSMLLGFKKASKTWLFVVQRVQCLWNSIIIIFRPLSCDMQKIQKLNCRSTSMQFSMICNVGSLIHSFTNITSEMQTRLSFKIQNQLFVNIQISNFHFLKQEMKHAKNGLKMEK